MKRKSLFIVPIILAICSSIYAAWPSDSVRTKNWGSEVLTDTDLEAQYDLIHTFINDMMDETTGHKHDGTSNEGVLIDLNDDAGVIGVKNQLDVANGGTGVTTLTDGGIMLGSGTGDVTVMAVLSDGELVIGDGTTDPTTLAAFTSSSGQLKHEYGGIEANISAIAKGGVLSGTGTGSMGITTVGTNGQILKADSSAGGGISWADGFVLDTSQTPSSATASGDMTITTGTWYLVIFNLTMDGSSSTISVRFNNDSTGNDYKFVRHGYSSGGAIDDSQTSQNEIDIGTVDANSFIMGSFFIRHQAGVTSWCYGSATYLASSNVTFNDFSGQYAGGSPTSVELVGTNTFSGNVYLYKLPIN